jgi:hypothetical protein
MSAIGMQKKAAWHSFALKRVDTDDLVCRDVEVRLELLYSSQYASPTTYLRLSHNLATPYPQLSPSFIRD